MDTTDEVRGATVVITHRVRDGGQAGYEAWLERISVAAKASAGILDWHLVRPIDGLTWTYTVIIRFDSTAHLQGWITSDTRQRLIDEVRPLLAGNDDFFIRTGLDFWFIPEGARAKVPVRWKQFVLTWSALFPLAVLGATVIAPLLRWLGLPDRGPLLTLCVTGSVLWLMVFVVMPRYTRLVKNWLFR